MLADDDSPWLESGCRFFISGRPLPDRHRQADSAVVSTQVSDGCPKGRDRIEVWGDEDGSVRQAVPRRM